MLQYNDSYSSLPPAVTSKKDKPPSSWRVRLFPDYHDSAGNALKYSFDEPWNGPQNSLISGNQTKMFHCPLDPAPLFNTSYLAVIGPKTLFPNAGQTRPEDIINSEYRKNEYGDRLLTGGAENTIVLVERHNSGIHWMEPRDISIDDLCGSTVDSTRPSIQATHSIGLFEGGGPRALFADGSVRYLNPNIDPKLLRSLLEIDNPDKPKEKYNSP